MSKVETGGNAFPISYRAHNDYGREVVHVNNGMSLRDHFAGQALTGFIGGSHHEMATVAETNNTTIIKVASSLAYAYADAMIAARGH